MGIGKLLVSADVMRDHFAIIPGRIVGSAACAQNFALLVEADGIPDGCDLQCVIEVTDRQITSTLTVIG